MLGHSQGVLAVHMVQAICEAGSIDAAAAKIDEILAIATLIGVAGTRQARQLGLAARHGEATPMLSVKDITRAQVDALIERVDGARGPIAVAVTNSATHYVLSGYPEDLAAFGVEVAKEHKRQAKLREEKVRGGRVFDPTLEYLDVTLPFHSPLMADAVSQAVAWAEACGINADHARELAAEVLLNHVDWAARVRALMKSTDPSALWVLDFGPGNTVGKLFSTVAQGTGVGVVEASTVADRGALSTLETLPERTQNWTRFAPSIIHTSAGDKVRTAFTELTGKAPVLLAGMTPTTVEPEIVAATGPSSQAAARSPPACSTVTWPSSRKNSRKAAPSNSTPCSWTATCGTCSSAPSASCRRSAPAARRSTASSSPQAFRNSTRPWNSSTTSTPTASRT